MCIRTRTGVGTHTDSPQFGIEREQGSPLDPSLTAHPSTQSNRLSIAEGRPGPTVERVSI